MKLLAEELKQTMAILTREQQNVQRLAARFPQLTAQQALRVVLQGRGIVMAGGMAAIFPRRKYAQGSTHIVELRQEIDAEAIVSPLHTHFSGRQDGVELTECWTIFSPGVVTFYVEDEEGDVIVDFRQDSNGNWLKTAIADDPQHQMRPSQGDRTMRLRMREEILSNQASITLVSDRRRLFEAQVQSGSSVLEMTLWTEKIGGEGGDSWLDRNLPHFSY